MLIASACPLSFSEINYLTRLEFIRRQWTYASTGIDASSDLVPRRRSYLSSPAREFWRRFIERRGYRDGLAGLFMAVVMALASARRVWLERRIHMLNRTGR